MRNEVETRSLGTAPELRARNNKPLISGVAAVLDSRSENLGGFYEIIEKTAFEGADMSDVRALFNHDGIPMARTASGTLELTVTDRGLEYSFEPGDSNFTRDVLDAVKRGDISQSSFAFTVADEDWNDRLNGVPVRRIKRFAKIYDVSLVTFPAYGDTQVALRSMELALRKQAPAAMPRPFLNELKQKLFDLKYEY